MGRQSKQARANKENGGRKKSKTCDAPAEQPPVAHPLTQVDMEIEESELGLPSQTPKSNLSSSTIEKYMKEIHRDMRGNSQQKTTTRKPWHVEYRPLPSCRFSLHVFASSNYTILLDGIAINTDHIVQPVILEDKDSIRDVMRMFHDLVPCACLSGACHEEH